MYYEQCDEEVFCIPYLVGDFGHNDGEDCGYAVEEVRDIDSIDV